MSTIAQPVPFFGRAFSLSINTPDGKQVTISSASALPALRVVFEVSTGAALSYIWQAKITIFNLGASTATQIAAGSAYGIANSQGILTPTLSGQSLLFTQELAQGNLVSLSAGYQAPGSSTFNSQQNLIYTGNLLQSYGTRENVTDTKLVLRCITNLALISFAFTNLPRAAGQNDLAALRAIMTQAQVNIANIDAASMQALQNSNYSRGQALFGRTTNHIDTICGQNNIFPWIASDGLHVRSYTPGPLTPKIIYAPPNLKNPPTGTSTTTVKPTIIGTPAQTQDGIVFRVLLDTQVKLWDTIQVATEAGTAINAFEFPYGTLPPLPNIKGVFIVVSLRYVGDTRGRGDDWYTELTCLTPQWFSSWATRQSASAKTQ